MSESDWLSASLGTGGWVRFDSSDWPGPVYVRFRADAERRLTIRELYLDAGETGSPLRGSDLRTLDLTRLTAIAREQWVDGQEQAPGPDLSRLASHWKDLGGRPKVEHWVKTSFRAQYADADVLQAPRGTRPRAVSGQQRPETLSAPAGPITDEFLRHVAAAYYSAIRTRTRSPARSLAEQASVSVRTVHAWVAKARDRNIMPQTSRGKVG